MEKEVQEVPDQKPKMWGPISGIFLGLTIFIAAQILASIIIATLAQINGVSVTEYFKQNTVIASFVGSAALGGLTITLVYHATKSYGSWAALKLKNVDFSSLLMVIPAFVGYIILSGTLYMLAGKLFPDIDLEQAQETGFENVISGVQVAIAFVALVVIAPISEEILFRGYTFQGIRSKTHWLVAAVITSALFGLAHGQINVGMDTFALGIAACWLLEKTNSLWPAILLHGLKNSIAFYYLFIAS